MSSRNTPIPAPRKPHRYEVVVGNVGNVYAGGSRLLALGAFRSYVLLSQNGHGAVAGEPVTMFDSGEVVHEYAGTPAGGEV